MEDHLRFVSSLVRAFTRLICVFFLIYVYMLVGAKTDFSHFLSRVCFQYVSTYSVRKHILSIVLGKT